MASLTDVFGGQPSTDDSTVPASTVDDSPDDGGATTQGFQEADDGGASTASAPSGPLGPPSGEPEPFDSGF